MQEKYSRSWFLLRWNISQNYEVAHENSIRCSLYNWTPRRNFPSQFPAVLNIAQRVNRRIEGGKTSQCSLELGTFPQIRTMYVYFQKFPFPLQFFTREFPHSASSSRFAEIFHDNWREFNTRRYFSLRYTSKLMRGGWCYAVQRGRRLKWNTIIEKRRSQPVDRIWCWFKFAEEESL